MQQPKPFDPSKAPRNIQNIASVSDDEYGADENDPPLLENVSSFTDNPDVIDGTADSFASKTAAGERAEAKIERPMQEKLDSTKDIGKLKKACADAIAELTQFELDRSEINSEMQAIRERLEALGVGKKPLAMAVAYTKMNTKQRDGFDTAYALLRSVIGEPVQSDLFDKLFSGFNSDSDTDAA